MSSSPERHAELTGDQLRKILNYDPQTGEFSWLVKLSARRMPGQKAGTNSSVNGYRYISINRRSYLAHRLAWFWVHGEWPPEQIDHINGVRADNRISNLRVATSSQNTCNSKKPRTNTSGFKGVVWHRQSKKWRAQIGAAGKFRHIGLFSNIEDAAAAYSKAAQDAHGEFAWKGGAS